LKIDLLSGKIALCKLFSKNSLHENSVAEESQEKKEKKLLDQVRDFMRLKHYSIHTERTYCEWIKRYIFFHKMVSREDLKNGEEKIEKFLTHLAVAENVAPSTQNQAMNALVFLYKKVLKQSLNEEINAVRAAKKTNVPVVLTRDEVRGIIPLLKGDAQLVVKLLYGSGLRIMEAIRLRVHDIDYAMKQLTVRSGKGAKDRITTFPESVIPLLENHLRKVKLLHEQDLAQGYGKVYLPYALARKYPHADSEWGWQYVFPSSQLSRDPRTAIIRRHHIDPSVVNKAIKIVVKKLGLKKTISAHTFRLNFRS
jgi:integron integrase